MSPHLLSVSGTRPAAIPPDPGPAATAAWPAPSRPPRRGRWLGLAVAVCLSGLGEGRAQPWQALVPMLPTEVAAVPTEADQALAELLQAHAGSWAVVAWPGGSPAERREARAALHEDLEMYLESYPGSRWGLSLRLTLGTFYQRQARWSRALPHLESAWLQSLDPLAMTDPRLVERAQVAWGLALLELGRVEALEELMVQSNCQGPSSAALGAHWRAIRESWLEVRREPALASMLCGAHALASLAHALGERQPSVPDILAAATAQDAGGFSLGRLHEIGRWHGLGLQAAVRPPGSAWVVPALVHGKADLWRTVVGLQGSGFWVQDPARGRLWMQAEELEEETSGYSLVHNHPAITPTASTG